MLQAGTNRRAAITTLGCKINTYESAVIAQKLQKDNWTVVSSRDAADLYVINSCTVTAEAGRQTRQEIRRAINRNPNALVVVTGCYAEMEPSACEAIPGVDLVIGNHDKLSLVDRLKDYPRKESKQGSLITARNQSDREFLNGYSGRTRAFVQIQQGCDQSCTFCVIHEARGASQSFVLSEVKDQIELLLENGYREIVVCGIDLGSWGEDFNDEARARKPNLTNLLQQISLLQGDYRVRLSSIDPAHISNDLLDVISTNQRICPHLHLSMQSANALVLKRMKRRYDPAVLYDRVLTAQKKISGLVLSGDVLVGFPTETDKQFEDTLRAIEDLRIAYPHVFPYSQRGGTPAARIPNQVPKPVRKERSARVRLAGRAVLESVLSEHRGVRGRVLIERSPSTKRNYKHGRLDNYLPVHIADMKPKIGEFLEVQVMDTCGDILIARRRHRE